MIHMPKNFIKIYLVKTARRRLVEWRGLQQRFGLLSADHFRISRLYPAYPLRNNDRIVVHNFQQQTISRAFGYFRKKLVPSAPTRPAAGSPFNRVKFRRNHLSYPKKNSKGEITSADPAISRDFMYAITFS